MNYATALRQGVGERLHKYIFWLPLPLLDFDALMSFTMMSINLFYQFWIHTELVNRLPAPGWSHDGEDRRSSVLRQSPA
jgi:sterol desaturase/sphingolipid hydroxylase (fatty acid hydroxylase superfamily)